MSACMISSPTPPSGIGAGQGQDRLRGSGRRPAPPSCRTDQRFATGGRSRCQVCFWRPGKAPRLSIASLSGSAITSSPRLACLSVSRRGGRWRASGWLFYGSRPRPLQAPCPGLCQGQKFFVKILRAGGLHSARRLRPAPRRHNHRTRHARPGIRQRTCTRR